MIELSQQVDHNSFVSGNLVSGANSSRNNADDADVKLVKRLLQEGARYRSRFDCDWKKRGEYYEGKQWPVGTDRSRPVMNIIRQMIQATLPILTDQRPGFSVLAKEPSDYEFAKIIGELVETWWEASSVDQVIIEALHNSMLYDAGVLKVTWDNEASGGIGDVVVESVSPFDIYVPEGARDFNKSCPWVIHRTRKSVGELRRMFPDHADDIQADDTVFDNKQSTDDITLVSPTNTYTSTEASFNMADSRKMCEVVECWIDDDAVVEEKLVDEYGNESIVTKKKYPRGRLITILPGRNLLLQSTTSPYEHGMKPFVRVVDMVLPGEFWGEGEAKCLMHTQRLINKTLKHIFDTFQLMSNPIWKVRRGCGVEPEAINNSVSTVYELDDPSSIHREFPPVIQSGAIEIYEMLVRQAEAVSGISEVSQGRRPIGVTAASAIENLQDAAQTRIRMKERNLQTSLTQLGRQVISLMLQFYRDARVVRISNKSGIWPEYKEFFIEDQEGGYRINSQSYVYSESSGKYVPSGYRTTPVSKGLLDVKVVAGTAMPWAKTTRANIAFRLYESRAIDSKELLDALEWPNSEKVVERMSKEQTQEVV